jgi:hypothetical protein
MSRGNESIMRWKAVEIIGWHKAGIINRENSRKRRLGKLPLLSSPLTGED